MEPDNTQSTPATPNQDVIRIDMDEARSTASKASWWLIGIAFLSFINSFMVARGHYFVVGLAITQLIDGIVQGLSGQPNYYISLIVPILFVLLGIFGLRLSRAAFIAGAILYVFDTLIYMLFLEWFAIAFHLFILYRLYKGYQSVREYHTLDAQLVKQHLSE